MACLQGNCNFQNVTFSNCEAGQYGGALLLSNSEATIKDTTFSSCRASKCGGAVYQTSASTSTFTRTRFISNAVQGGDGGSICSKDSSDLRLHRSEIADSVATATSGKGGAIYAAGQGSLVLRDCNVTNATAGGDGGAIYRTSHAVGAVRSEGRNPILAVPVPRRGGGTRGRVSQRSERGLVDGSPRTAHSWLGWRGF